jgi:hypothetical protein
MRQRGEGAPLAHFQRCGELVLIKQQLLLQHPHPFAPLGIFGQKIILVPVSLYLL